jgi:hypothetical protein
MPQFRKKPVVIEAEQMPVGDGALPFQADRPLRFDDGKWFIDTLEGKMFVNDGDWVIRGVKGEFYPCKPDIFEATYDAVEEICADS